MFPRVFPRSMFSIIILTGFFKSLFSCYLLRGSKLSSQYRPGEISGNMKITGEGGLDGENISRSGIQNATNSSKSEVSGDWRN